MTLQMYKNPNRLMKPLKRVGERGKRIQRITWDQALDQIAEKLTAIRDNYGADSLAIQAGSRTGVLNIMGTVPLFADLWGTNNACH